MNSRGVQLTGPWVPIGEYLMGLAHDNFSRGPAGMTHEVVTKNDCRNPRALMSTQEEC